MLEFRGVTAGYGGAAAVREIAFTAPKGEMTTLVGPNGCGKTTLLRTAARQLSPLAGEVLLAGRPLGDYGRRELARTVAVLPQVREVPAITVRGLVSHGRFPHLGLGRRMRPADREAVDRAMEETDVARWAHRDLRSLSGGERQRVYLAMALAQDTELLLLDEPTSGLDLLMQRRFVELVQAEKHRGATIMLSSHLLGEVEGTCDRAVFIRQGRLVCTASAGELTLDGVMGQLYGPQALQRHWGDGRERSAVGARSFEGEEVRS